MDTRIIPIRCKGTDSIPITELKFFQGNLKDLKESEYKKLRTSIEKYGFRFPVFTWQNNILDGHQRIFTIQKMMDEGWSVGDIPIVEVQADSEKEAKKLLLLISSRYGHVTEEGFYEFLSLSDLDWEELKAEIDFPEIDWKKFEESYYKSEPQDAEPQIDRAEELNKKWQVKTGDLWQIGEHRLLCGDSTKKEDVERVMGGEKVDCVVTDPPYGIDLDTDYSKMGNTTTKYKKIVGDNVAFNPKYIFDLFPAKSYWLWGADYYLDKLPDGGSLMVWAKAHQEDENKVFGSSFEICWTFPKRKRELWFIRRIHMTDELLSEHPTQKPSECMMRPIQLSGDNIIADPFLGSGTTMVACQNLNRKCRGIEISPAYCAVILERMETAFPGIEIKRIEECQSQAQHQSQQLSV